MSRSIYISRCILGDQNSQPFGNLHRHEKVPKLELLHHILTYLGGISPYISLLQALHIVPPILLLPKSHAQQTSCHQRHPGAIHGHCDQQWWRWSLGCGQKLAGDPTGAGRRPSCWDGVIPWDPRAALPFAKGVIAIIIIIPNRGIGLDPRISPKVGMVALAGLPRGMEG